LVDEHNLWGIEADRGKSTRLRGDRDALRPRAYDRQRRHQTRIVSGRAFSGDDNSDLDEPERFVRLRTPRRVALKLSASGELRVRDRSEL
jgi:hypothetical protein